MRANTIVKVKLWETTIGHLVWEKNSTAAAFQYAQEYLDMPWDMSPGTYSKKRYDRRPLFGIKGEKYQGLPPFIADSLPDSWGNKLFDQWATENKMTPDSVNPLMKLSFIGKRGMGGLEFEPETGGFEDLIPVDLDSLYRMAMEVLQDRLSATISGKENLTLKNLVALGTSAGGKHAKGLIAINDKTGEIRSGQIALPKDFRYYIIKFKEEADVPTSEIEQVYHRMAVNAGIKMTECALKEVEGTSHFITERYDRLGGEKIHALSLSAMAPGAKDYCNLMWTADSLNLGEAAKQEIFRRMVFNHLAGITDDHDKNFTFLMDRNGKWGLSPAYDLIFTANVWKDPSASIHSLGLSGKHSNVTIEDMVEFAEDFDIANGKEIIEKVSDSISAFDRICDEYNVDKPWVERISGILNRLTPGKTIIQTKGNDTRKGQPEDPVLKIIQDKYNDKDIILMTDRDNKACRVLHMKINGTNMTFIHDHKTGDICKAYGFHDKGSFHMANRWTTLYGKQAGYTPTTVMSLISKKKLGIQ